MAKILFTWELGTGLGHLIKYLGLAEKFRAGGHEVLFAIRDLSSAERFFGARGLSFVQAPFRLGEVKKPIAEGRTYADIIHNSGFDDGAILMGHVRAWRTLYGYIEPDIILFDHSPTAQLASRGLDLKRVLVGSGFVVPPQVSPFAELKYLEPKAGWSPQADEAGMVEMINPLMDKLGAPPLESLSDILEADARYLFSFPEFDHYERETEQEFIGIGPEDKGAEPRWPEGEGKKVFAYLNNFELLPNLLQELSRTGSPAIVYGSGFPDELVMNLASPTVRFSRKPLNLVSVGRECDLAITSAGHNATTALLLSGVPVMQIPLHMEQYITAKNTEKLGAGLVSIGPDDIVKKLPLMLSSDSYAEAARKFASRHADFDLEERDRKLAQKILALLG